MLGYITHIPLRGVIGYNIQSQTNPNCYWELTHDKFNPFHFLTHYGKGLHKNYFYSEEEVLQEEFKRRDKAKLLQNELNLNQWWSVAQIISMSLSDWKRLTSLEQYSIFLLAEETIQEKNKQYNEQKRQQELALAESAKDLKFPNQVQSSISRFLQS